VNPYAADPGDVVKHLVLAELLHVERRRITTYIDTHSGRPWNDLSRPGYTFADADRQPRAAWADDFMKLAVSGVLGRDVRTPAIRRSSRRIAAPACSGDGLVSRRDRSTRGRLESRSPPT
jgi:hypothetical protein